MKRIIRDALLLAFVLISGLCLFSRVRADEAPTTTAETEAEAVFTLTNANFDAFIADNAAVLVEFYAPWCGHCKALEPEFEKSAQSIARGAHSEVHAKLAKVDATLETELAERFGIDGFPTLKFFTDGDVASAVDYKGGYLEIAIILALRSLAARRGVDRICQSRGDVARKERRRVHLLFRRQWTRRQR